jgi:ATP-dependent DNA ligase
LSGHDTGDGELILQHAGKLGFEGVVSKTVDAPYAPGNRGLWRKAKALNREEFVVVGWSDPEGSRPHLGALLLGYYTDDGLAAELESRGVIVWLDRDDIEPGTRWQEAIKRAICNGKFFWPAFLNSLMSGIEAI